VILFAGDTHGDQRWLGRMAQQLKPAALVHLGDIQLEHPPEQELEAVLANTRFCWIPGNHDFDSLDYYERLHAPALSSGALHGRVTSLCGVRVAGLGGWFRAGIWRPPERPTTKRKTTDARRLSSRRPDVRLAAIRELGAIWWEDYEALWHLTADVLVCHEAPSCHRHGFQVIDDLAKAMGVKTIFHGHHHETYAAELPGGIRVFGVGLRAVVDLHGRVIWAGERNAGGTHE
jgi:predicted phosphodiesterase